MKTAPLEKQTSPPVSVAPAGAVKRNSCPAPKKHFNDWPNDAAFNATGDTRQKIEVPITGRLPSYVAGTLYRTGPGGYQVPRENPKDGVFACSHWFDGFCTTHKFDLEQDAGTEGCTRAMYSSYCHVDEMIEQARKTGKLDGITFGQKRDPCDTLFRKFKSVFSPASANGNIGVTMREPLPAELKDAKVTGDRRVFTLTTDANPTKLVDAETLEPLGLARQNGLHPSLKGPLSGAHAAKDPVTGDIFNYNLELGPKPTYRVFRADAKTGKVDILAEVSGSDIQGSYLHSMFITENFLVLCIWPAYFTSMGASILWNRNLLDAMAPFDPKAQTTWVVIDRQHNRGVVKKYKSPAFFSFHTINAWEEESSDGTVDIFCELSEHKNLDILHHFYYENMVSTGKGVHKYLGANHHDDHLSQTRYRLSNVTLGPKQPKSKSTTAKAERVLRILGPNAGDLPNINPAYATRKHRYVYATLARGKSSFLDGLGKTDNQTSECLVWEKERHTPGEPVFIADPEGKDEDAGAVLSVVLDGDRGTSYLLCLDAKTMTEIGRVDVGRAVGMGFHGMHVPRVV